LPVLESKRSQTPEKKPTKAPFLKVAQMPVAMIDDKSRKSVSNSVLKGLKKFGKSVKQAVSGYSGKNAVIPASETGKSLTSEVTISPTNARKSSTKSIAFGRAMTASKVDKKETEVEQASNNGPRPQSASLTEAFTQEMAEEVDTMLHATD
jgi:hypothetical protein